MPVGWRIANVSEASKSSDGSVSIPVSGFGLSGSLQSVPARSIDAWVRRR